MYAVYTCDCMYFCFIYLLLHRTFVMYVNFLLHCSVVFIVDILINALKQHNLTVCVLNCQMVV